jgi:hypothetical protein
VGAGLAAPFAPAAPFAGIVASMPLLLISDLPFRRERAARSPRKRMESKMLQGAINRSGFALRRGTGL